MPNGYRGLGFRIARPSRRLRFIAGIAFAALFVVGKSAHALLFDVTYDPSVSGAPAGFTSAFSDAIQMYQSTYTDPITINMNVGWGEIDGNPLNPGNLGQSRTNQPGNFTYSQVRSALISDAKSAADFQAVSTLGATDPTGGRAFRMSDAEAKALGLRAGNDPGIDGWVGFSNTATYTFDPNNRAVAGEFDFIGVAEHEIAEVMGRYGMTQNGCGATLCDSPIDLFRYTSPGNFDLNPENGSYFSIDSGNTNINTFNGTSGGDLSDWLGLTLDAFNHSLSRGQEEPFTAGDRTLMDVIGYDPAVVPEPGTLALLATSLIGLGAMRWRLTQR
jgi:PEP-CTERM motif